MRWRVDPPQPLNLYRGCAHHRRLVSVGDRKLHVLEYDMGDFLKSTVQVYLEVFPTTAQLPGESSLPNKRALSPCMPQTHSEAEAANASEIDRGRLPRGPAL